MLCLKKTINGIIMNDDIIQKIIDYPHLLGRLLGFTKLKKLHSDMINYAYDMSNLKKSVWAHRGAYKTTAIVVVGIVRLLLFNPNLTIGIFKKTFTDSCKLVKNISTLLKNEDIAIIFKYLWGFTPVLSVDREDCITLAHKTRITKEGNVNAFSVMSPITGYHLDVGIFDDFVTIEDKISRAIRNKTKIMLEELINNVLNPGALALFVGTPFCNDSAWDLCPAPVKWDVYSTHILSNKEIFEKKQKMTGATFACNYELKIISDDDAIFKNPNYANWDFNYKNGIGHIDKKFGGNDTMALTFVAKKNDGRYQCIGFIFYDDLKKTKRDIFDLWKKYNIGTIYTEDNDDKGFASDLLKKLGIKVETYHESKNKHIKILNHLLENDFYDLIDFDTSIDANYMTQILDYRELSSLDDAPDSLASIGRILINEEVDYFTERWNNV